MKFKSNVELEALSNATTDTDRFIVSDSNTLKYRTGSQVLSDIGGQASLTNPVTGTGTLNFVSKFTSTGSTLGNSLIFDNGTNVGIGTTSPSEKLHVVGSVLIEGSSTKLKVKGSGGYDTANITMGNAAKADSFSIDTRNDPGDNKTTLSFDSYLTTGTSTITLGDNYVNLGTAGSTRLVINSSGNVGIGTTSPGAKLDIRTSSDQAIFASTDGGYNALEFTSDSGTTTGSLIAYNNTIRLGNASGVGGWLNGIVIDSAGNVGIGTTSPGFKLDVSGNGIRNIRTTAGWAGWFENTGSSSGVIVTAGVDSGDAPLLIRKQDGTELFSVRGNGTSWFNGGNVGIGTTSPSAKVMRVRGDGNVGIGVTSPNEKLQVGGNINAYINGGIDAGLFASTSAGSTTIALRSNGVTHFNGGNVGIGTTSPAHKLTINAPNNTTAVGIDFPSARFDFSANSTSGYNSRFHMDNVGMDIGHDSISRSLNLITGDVDRLVILGNGNVGIGTTSPSQKLEVNGNAIIGGGTLDNPQSWGKILQVQNTGSNGAGISVKDSNNEWNLATYNGVFNISDGIEERIIINSSGNVGIGTASPNANLYVKGTAGGVNWLTVGDSAYTLLNVDNYGRTSINRQLSVGSSSGYSNVADVKLAITGLSGQTGNYLDINSNGTTGGGIFTVRASGNVGIGTTSPGAYSTGGTNYHYSNQDQVPC
jgi:hypothetical protein